MDITAADMESLGVKLDGLELNDAERSILDGIIERAAEAGSEVEGYLNYEEIKWEFASPTARKIASVWTDMRP